MKIYNFLWGIILLVVGVCFIFRMPHILHKINTINSFSEGLFFLKISMCFIGIILIGGGIKKIFTFFVKNK